MWSAKKQKIINCILTICFFILSNATFGQERDESSYKLPGPDVNFSISDENDPHASVGIFSLKEKLLPAGVLDAAKPLSTGGGEQQIGLEIGPGGKFAASRFSFFQGLNFCTMRLDNKGKSLKKPECSRGASGGAE